jgi:hypothetical protein
MIFNGSKKVFSDYHFFFIGEEIEITISSHTWGLILWASFQFEDMLFNLRSIRAMDYSLAQETISSRTSHPRCLSWIPLSNP